MKFSVIIEITQNRTIQSIDC